ncbi:hypothetical protein HYH03_012501 [Edaphochlamys debaryana]|uniref:EGF-like domain-containing protein n=1 Tax=Edaphochlamys debaryana TaxID=47281 RepID=A0A835XY84_9CHLO|nr:hypothetical protein HYH03_012501 [Edaphochlamys debaryana]|eukprot:KAG2489065.1 hypothetical protein HYH03_012501 [Edaphochlamys debaryana]
MEPGWTASRCAGICDVDRASCWCPAHTVYGRRPPPADAPPWVRFSERGRPISATCKPSRVRLVNGTVVTIDWGTPSLPHISLDDITGPNGWCNVAKESQLTEPARRGCACDTEPSLSGRMCEHVLEDACPNQCSGHGECDAGYCRCFPGWYGQECARKRAGQEMEPGLDISQRPWLQTTLRPVPAAATQPPPDAPGAGGGNTSAATASSVRQGTGEEEAGAEGAASTGAGSANRGKGRRGRRGGGGRSGSGGRLRPLIYVYDMPPEFTTRMHQYRLTTRNCQYRQYGPRNVSELSIGPYSIEAYLHEMLLLSPHRTFDPEEAAFFYVPVYFTCWTWPINGWSDGPFWGAPTCINRVSNAAHMWLAAKRWVQSHFPYWDRRGGRDHIFLTNHDEGACYMPTEIYETAIMLTHWGRLDLNHTSNTGWKPDNYTAGMTWPGVLGGADVRSLYLGHRCYDPRKDLVIPGLKAPAHYAASPLLGAAPYHRDILLYLRGDIGRHRVPNYSRGIRQKLYSLATTNQWARKHRIFVGDTAEIPGSYGEHLARSVFCAVVPGDGYAMRMEDAVLHGCLPLIIMDRTHALFESILDLDSFSLRIEEAAVNEHLPNLLKAISQGQIERMQRKLALVWHRFAYAQGATVRAAMRESQTTHANAQAIYQGSVPELHPFQPVTRFPVQVDALSTILQWLHGRIPYTRGEAGGTAAGGDAAAAATAAAQQAAAA